MRYNNTLFTTFVTLLCTAVLTHAQLEGSCTITPQDYYGLPAEALDSNPPTCGMPYNQLNLALITAATDLDIQTTCNTCLRVVNEDDPSKYLHVLAVDLGGVGLDLSIPAFEYLFGQGTDPSPASWSTVEDYYCEGIYTPGEVNGNQGVEAGLYNSDVASRKRSVRYTKKRSLYKK